MLDTLEKRVRIICGLEFGYVKKLELKIIFSYDDMACLVYSPTIYIQTQNYDIQRFLSEKSNIPQDRIEILHGFIANFKFSSREELESQNMDWFDLINDQIV